MYRLEGRTLFLDMDAIHIPDSRFLHMIREGWKQRQALYDSDPYAYSAYHRKRAYQTPEELQQKVDEYFKSCEGYRYYQGKPMYDAKGRPLKGQIEPYTISGLSRYLGIQPQTLLRYQIQARAGFIEPEFVDIIEDAKLRIQEYAEKRLYDRDGSSGARFVLEAGFGWVTHKEEIELQQSDKRIELAKAKLEFIRKQAEENKLEDKELTVNILRAVDED